MNSPRDETHPGSHVNAALEKTNFLEWTGLRHSIPPNLRNPNLDYVYQFQNPSFNLVNDLFDVTKKNQKITILC